MTDAVHKGLSAFKEQGLKAMRLGSVSRRVLGVVFYTFGPLLRDFGTAAGRDIAILERACEITLQTGSNSTHGAAFKAIRRLLRLAAKLPVDEQLVAIVELERRMQTLWFRNREFGETLAKAAENERGAVTLARKASRKAVRAAAENERLLELAHEVNANFQRRAHAARKTNQQLYASFRRLRKAVPPMAHAMLDAARKAAQQAEKFRDLLKQYGKSQSVEVLSQMWGIISGVRGSLGEGYALGCQVWRNQADYLLATAMNDANRLTDAAHGGARAAADDVYEAVEILQAEHRLLLNGLEGPDSVIAIINPTRRRMIIRARVQVKTAAVSKAVEQTMNDDLRVAGHEALQSDLPTAEFIRNGKKEIYVLEVEPSVPEDLFVLDFGGSSVQPADLNQLAAAGKRADSIIMDMTVDDFTALSLEMLETAMDSIK